MLRMSWQYFQRTQYKICASGRMCKVFSGRHLLVLHGLKFQKYEKKGNNADTDTKENRPEEVKCASANRTCLFSYCCFEPVSYIHTSNYMRLLWRKSLQSNPFIQY